MKIGDIVNLYDEVMEKDFNEYGLYDRSEIIVNKAREAELIVIDIGVTYCTCKDLNSGFFVDPQDIWNFRIEWLKPKDKDLVILGGD